MIMPESRKLPWMKFYPADWRADPRLRMCSLAARGLWIELIGYMHEGEPYGYLTINGTEPTIHDIAALVGQPPGDVRKAMAELERRQVYSADALQGAIYSRRMVRDRAKAEQDRKNGEGGGNPRLRGGVKEGVIPPDKAHIPEARDQKSEPEKKDTSLRSVDDWPADYGDLFWQAYPRKTEKLAAMKKLAALRKSRIVTFADLMAGVKRYAAATLDNDPKYVKQPTTWLNAGCWADEHQTGGFNGNRTGNSKTSGHDAILAVAARKARELDRNDTMARAASEAGFAGGAGSIEAGPNGYKRTDERAQRDYHGVEPDAQ